MYKKVIKNFISILIFYVMCFASFSAIISDNDGSAFITKQEFEALKSSFNKQIIDYNTSIDSKIDGAIASYLAGIKMDNPPNELLTKVNAAVGGTLYFRNSWPGTGVQDLTTNFRCDATRHYTYYYFNNLVWSAKAAFGNGGYVGSAIMAGWDPVGGSQATANNRLGYAEYCGYGGGDKYMNITWNGANYLTAVKITKNYTWGPMAGVLDKLSMGYDNVSNKINITNAGSGSGWVSETKPSGRKILKQWCSSMYPSTEIEIVAHTYKNCAPSKTTASVNTYSVTAGGYGDSTDLGTLAISQMTTWGVKTSGTKITGESTTAKAQYYSISQLMAKSSDGVDYSLFMWGKNADKLIYYQDENILPTVSSTVVTKEASDTASTFTRIYYPASGIRAGDNSLSGQKFTYYPISVSNTSGVANQIFSNDYVSTVAGQEVKIDGGIPIIEVLNDEYNVRLNLKFQCTKLNSDGSRTIQNDNVHYIISDKPFKNNIVDTSGGAITLGSGTIASGTLTPDITFMKDKKGVVWLTCYATTSGVDVCVDQMNVR